MSLQRHLCDPRPNWHQTVVEQGLTFVDSQNPETGEKFSYWTEDAYYSLTPEDKERLRAASAALQGMYIEAGDYVIRNNLFGRFGIPDWAVGAIKLTWQDDAERQYWPSVYGRFDLGMNGDTIKLFEYNADTPTCVAESTGVQWEWFEAQPGGGDQWNELYECLIIAWKRNITEFEARTGRKISVVHVAYDTADTSGEDYITTVWIADAIREAGYQAKLITMSDIQLPELSQTEKTFSLLTPTTKAEIGEFTDPDGLPIDMIFALYPWEWMIWEPFGKTIVWNTLRSMRPTMWVEPIYKMLWSNKAMLPILWQLFGNDPEKSQYLLPAYFEGEEPRGFRQGNYVRKPLLGREGANITVFVEGQPVEAQPGEYTADGYILQEYFDVQTFPTSYAPSGVKPVLGVWIVDNDPKGGCCLGIREDPGVTNNLSRFVPHIIR